MQWGILAISLAFGLHTMLIVDFADKHLPAGKLTLAIADKSLRRKKICLSITAWSLLAWLFIADFFELNEYEISFLLVSGVFITLGLGIMVATLPSETNVYIDNLPNTNSANLDVLRNKQIQIMIISFLLSGAIFLKLMTDDMVLLNSEIADCSPYYTIPTFFPAVAIGFVLHAYLMRDNKAGTRFLLVASLVFCALSVEQISTIDIKGTIAAIISIGVLGLLIGGALVVSGALASSKLNYRFRADYILLLLYTGILILLLARNETTIWLLEEYGCAPLNWRFYL